jgi:uncharacterized membrane protein
VQGGRHTADQRESQQGHRWAIGGHLHCQPGPCSAVLTAADRAPSAPAEPLAPPGALWLWCLALALVLWGAAALRHALLQSNAYDLGLFDQWAWLLARGLPPISSMEGVHVMADHAAWLFPLVALPYRWLPSIQWLFASQALALSLTALPLWVVARQAGLGMRLAWLACGLWWLQPVVFNANLFDFHPEVWAMPALAGCFWALRAGRRWLWLGLLLVLLGCRDGLALVVLGLGLAAALERRWRAAALAAGLGLGWLLLLSRWLYPLLRGGGPKAAAAAYGHLGGSVEAVALNLLSRPQRLLEQVGPGHALVYLLLLAVAVAPFWRRPSLPTLAAAIPLVAANLVSETSAQRTLIHHYNLPVAVIAVVAAIDGLAVARPVGLPWRRLAWATLCWAALAKPWFFTGPYLERFDQLKATGAAIASISPGAAVLTTSPLVPQLSQRTLVAFPHPPGDPALLQRFDVLLLDPGDPGWASDRASQERLLAGARQAGWHCRRWGDGELELCRRPGGAAAKTMPPPG